MAVSQEEIMILSTTSSLSVPVQPHEKTAILVAKSKPLGIVLISLVHHSLQQALSALSIKHVYLKSIHVSLSSSLLSP